MQESFKFGEVELPSRKERLQPGYYNLGVVDAKSVFPQDNKADGTPKTPYLEIAFGNDLAQMSEKFYITAKAITRLKYLYEAWVGQIIDKEINSTEQVATLFEKTFQALRDKKIKRMMVIGGKQLPNGNVYPQLNYTNFVLPTNQDYQEGAFEINSGNWIANVQIEAPSTMVADTNSIIVGANKKTEDDYSSDLPF